MEGGGSGVVVLETSPWEEDSLAGGTVRLVENGQSSQNKAIAVG